MASAGDILAGVGLILGASAFVTVTLGLVGGFAAWLPRRLSPGR
jgi:hypothetical protein